MNLCLGVAYISLSVYLYLSLCVAIYLKIYLVVHILFKGHELSHEVW